MGRFSRSVPALFEAPFFALAGALAAIAYARMQPNVAPLGAAAAFTICEWLRSIGVFAAPFDQLGYTQADSELRVIAAYAGTYGITFALCTIGAYVADALHRRTWRPLAVAIAALAFATFAAWIAWPARHLAPPTIPVAAIQGNIAQSFKWNALALAVHRYTAMTRTASSVHPRLVVWPETVITTELDANPVLLGRFSDLARDVHATIVAGSLAAGPGGFYNSLYIFSPKGGYSVYDKRQLVPFAEWFPGKPFLSWLPYVSALNGGLVPGRDDGVYTTSALPIAPLICWESAFADLAYAQVRRGAQAPGRQHRRRLVRYDVGTLYARADRAASRRRDRRVRRSGSGNRHQRHHRARRPLAGSQPAPTASDRHRTRRPAGRHALLANRSDDDRIAVGRFLRIACGAATQRRDPTLRNGPMRIKAIWRKRLALVAGLALGVYVIVEIVLAGGGTPPLPPNQAPIDLRGGHVMNNHIATKSWSFDYDHARLSPDGLSGTVDGVRNGIVFRKGKPYLRISAKHVVLNIQSLDFTAVGKVHIERIDDPQRRAFDTDLVTWTNDAKILRMTHPAYIHSGDQTLRIDGISVNFDDDTIHLGKVSGGVDVTH